MAKQRLPEPPAAPEGPTYGEQINSALTAGRAERIRRARARVPAPTYEQIAMEVGCCVKTVYNVLKAASAAP